MPGQHHVEDDERRLARLDQLARAVAVARLERREPVAAQVADDRRRGRSARRRRRAPSSSGLLRLPLGVVARRPVLADRAERDAAQRVPRRRVDHRQVEVADQEGERDVHQPVVQDDRAREAELRVALAEPEQQPRDQEEQREGGGEERVQLLAGVEAALRRRQAAREPAQVVAVEAVDLAGGAQDPAPVADERRSRRARRSRRRRVQKWTLWTSGRRPTAIERPAGRGSAPSRAGRRRRRRSPSAASARYARSGGGSRALTRRTRSSGRPRRSGRSRAAPSSRSARAGHQVDPLQPLDVLVAVHLRDHEPDRGAVLARERDPVHLVGEHHVVRVRPAAVVR